MFTRNVVAVVMVSFGLLTWKFVGENEKTVRLVSRDETEPPVKMTDGDRPQPDRGHMKSRPEEELWFKVQLSVLSGSLSYDTVFFLILIHMCGADAAALVSTACHHMCWACSFVDSALIGFGVFMVVRAKFQGKSEKAEQVENDTQREDVVTTLMEVKAELENQRNQLRNQLKEVEAEKEKNKEELQSVEQEITEREKTLHKPEELLREKEKLLRTQWKLDQTKKDTRRQLLNTERLMEPIKALFTRRHSLKDRDVHHQPEEK